MPVCCIGNSMSAFRQCVLLLCIIQAEQLNELSVPEVDRFDSTFRMGKNIEPRWPIAPKMLISKGGNGWHNVADVFHQSAGVHCIKDVNQNVGKGQLSPKWLRLTEANVTCHYDEKRVFHGITCIIPYY
uniref:Uncharacterized protein n=1 Tax=Trichuris muris TaxID=70415 RepID=A0A5S6R583_TRIMR